MKYRPEVDGLRAVAVLAVIIFHAGVGAVSGGFIGVDIFFVISGYLITTIIVAELQQGGFRYRKFIERRIRRILPALIFICITTVPFAYFWLLPDELENYGQTLVATALSANNIHGYITTNYWSLESAFKPLIHTWSLGVEEQYYLIVPILLAVLWKISRRTLPWAVGVIALASFGLAVLALSVAPSFAFYMLPARAWEIAAGAAVALILLRTPELRFHRAAPALSVVGFVMMVAPIFLLGENTPTPGLPLLVPVVGVCLIICFGSSENAVGMLLSARPVVFVGLISFSAYLWHQPLFAFLRIYSPEKPPLYAFLLLAAVSLGLAWATWRWVENPFRSRNMKTRTVYSATALGVLIMVGIGMGFHFTNGLPSRHPQTTNVANATIAYNQSVLSYKADKFVSAGDRDVLVLGDSFGRDFINAVNETFSERRLDSVEIIYRDDFPRCLNEANQIVSELYAMAEVIIMASERPECVAENLDKAAADGKSFILVGVKHFGANLNWLMRTHEWSNRKNVVPKEILAEEAHLREQVPPEHYLSWLDGIVHDGLIPITDGRGRLLTSDRVHFSQVGAEYFGSKALPGSPVDMALFEGDPVG